MVLVGACGPALSELVGSSETCAKFEFEIEDCANDVHDQSTEIRTVIFNLKYCINEETVSL